MQTGRAAPLASSAEIRSGQPQPKVSTSTSLASRGGRVPGDDLDPGGTVRRHPGQRASIVDRQAHLLAAGGEIGRQPPGEADVAEVVDDAAEKCPAHPRRLSKADAGKGSAAQSFAP